MLKLKPVNQPEPSKLISPNPNRDPAMITKKVVLFILISFASLSLKAVGSSDAYSVDDFTRALEEKVITKGYQPCKIEAAFPKGLKQRKHYDSASKISMRVYFETNRAVIRRDSYPMLANLAQAMNDPLSDAVFELAGHADQRGDDGYNMALSLRRSKAVERYLSDYHAVAHRRLKATGYGERKPVIDPAYSASDYAQNRRVVVARVATICR
jgi:outer membrane protein OmpA-like peptidoglycan-associated protein